MALLDDRDVELLGSHLSGLQIDFIVSGGIACIEAPKAIRELRRYGASVRVILTASAEKFVSKEVFEWASKNPVVSSLTGQAEHLSSADILCVYPCTLNMISKISLGLADTPATTLVQSLLERKLVVLQPSMHESLLRSPAYRDHSRRLSQMKNLVIVDGLQEEGKSKAIDAKSFAARVCREYARSQMKETPSVLVLMGPTRSYLDDIRFLTNYSSGSLGLAIADECYRRGFDLHLITGVISQPISKLFSTEIVETATEMEVAAQSYLRKNPANIIFFAAAVLDFEVKEKQLGKKASADQDWTVHLEASSKLIDSVGLECPVRVGFKLESGLDEKDLSKKLADWSKNHRVDLVCGNRKEDVSASQHRAHIFDVETNKLQSVQSKKLVAHELLEMAAQKYFKKNKSQSQKSKEVEKPKPSEDRSISFV